jgi:hypothetical protein
MKVDRTKFLLLTGAISAAVACTVNSTTNNDGTNNPPAPPPADDGGTDSATDGGGDAAGDGGACLGDTTTGDGGILTCGAASCPTTCTTVANEYRPGVAEATIECLLALPTCEGGGTPDTHACADKALAKACDDTDATTTCAKLVAACSADAGDASADGGATFDQTSCQTLVRGLTASARTSFISCVTEGFGLNSGNCQSAPTGCFDSFKP